MIKSAFDHGVWSVLEHIDSEETSYFQTIFTSFNFFYDFLYQFISSNL